MSSLICLWLVMIQHTSLLLSLDSELQQSDVATPLEGDSLLFVFCKLVNTVVVVCLVVPAALKASAS